MNLTRLEGYFQQKITKDYRTGRNLSKLNICTQRNFVKNFNETEIFFDFAETWKK